MIFLETRTGRRTRSAPCSRPGEHVAHRMACQRPPGEASVSGDGEGCVLSELRGRCGLVAAYPFQDAREETLGREVVFVFS